MRIKLSHTLYCYASLNISGFDYLLYLKIQIVISIIEVTLRGTEGSAFHLSSSALSLNGVAAGLETPCIYSYDQVEVTDLARPQMPLDSRAFEPETILL